MGIFILAVFPISTFSFAPIMFVQNMVMGAGIAFSIGGLVAGTNVLWTWFTGSGLSTMIENKTGLPAGGV